jgi:hypothetical protein
MILQIGLTTCKRAFWLLSILFVATLDGASAAAAPHQKLPPPARILFIGNSLTYVNDLPGIVRALAHSSGRRGVVVEDVAFPGFSLDDHRQAGDAERAIARGRWDVVVLQQGPSALPESRVQLIAATRHFAAAIAKGGGRTALYSVWPAESRRFDFQRASESYRLAAAEVDGIFLPVADAWLAAWRRDSTLALYSPDGLHPTRAGSYLAALVVAGALFDRAPAGLAPPSGLEIDGETAALLQRAASDALRRGAK